MSTFHLFSLSFSRPISIDSLHHKQPTPSNGSSAIVSISANSPLLAGDFHEQGGSCSPKDVDSGASPKSCRSGTLTCAVCGDISSGQYNAHLTISPSILLFFRPPLWHFSLQWVFWLLQTQCPTSPHLSLPGGHWRMFGGQSPSKSMSGVSPEEMFGQRDEQRWSV